MQTRACGALETRECMQTRLILWIERTACTEDVLRNHRVDQRSVLLRIGGVDEVVRQALRGGELVGAHIRSMAPPGVDQSTGEAVVEPWLGGVGDDSDM